LVGDAEAPAVLVLCPPIGRADIPVWCERLAALVRGSDARVVTCDLTDVVEADAVLVETLARLQLTAVRLGRTIQLYRASEPLTRLLVLTGLYQVIRERSGPHERSGLEPGRQPEHWEETLGVEERVDPDDPSR
jgi:ABC-type transporter Mla MlaB component